MVLPTTAHPLPCANIDVRNCDVRQLAPIITAVALGILLAFVMGGGALTALLFVGLAVILSLTACSTCRIFHRTIPNTPIQWFNPTAWRFPRFPTQPHVRVGGGHFPHPPPPRPGPIPGPGQPHVRVGGGHFPHPPPPPRPGSIPGPGQPHVRVGGGHFRGRSHRAWPADGD